MGEVGNSGGVGVLNTVCSIHWREGCEGIGEMKGMEREMEMNRGRGKEEGKER